MAIALIRLNGQGVPRLLDENSRHLSWYHLFHMRASTQETRALHQIGLIK